MQLKNLSNSKNPKGSSKRDIVYRTHGWFGTTKDRIVPGYPDVKEIVEQIREKYLHYGETQNLNHNTAVRDIRLLLEEIDRLETELYELEETYT